MKRRVSVRSMIALLLCLSMVLSFVPAQVMAADVDNFDTSAFNGLKLSVLGDSISTFEGVSNNTSYNSTLGDNIVYYWKNDAQGTGVDVQSETWWQQTIDALGMSLCVNNSYSGSYVASAFNGDPAAYVDRCLQLHNRSNVNPDIIAFFMGANDTQHLTSAGPVGTVEAAKKMTASSTPSTILDAYAVMLQKSMAKYPNAEFYCFTLPAPQEESMNGNVAAVTTFNAGVIALAEHFGAYVVDLYNDSGIHTDKLSRGYFMANDLHPNEAGMDAIANCFISSMLENSKYVTEDTCKVTYDLANVYVKTGTVSGSTMAGDVTTVVTGKPFAIELAGDGEIDITVTMGGKDITAEAVSGNTVSIDKVTGDVAITALELNSFYWKAHTRGLNSGSAFDAAYTYNNLTKLSGTYSGATFNSTGVTFQLDQPINLLHNRPWVLEFEASGSWTNGSFLFSYTKTSAVLSNTYLFRTATDGLLALGIRSSDGYEHYGVGLTSDVKITASDTHVYRLENRINADGSNMVYLTVDGGTAYAMNNHYDATTDTGTTANELSGRDLTFCYMGTSNHPLRNGTINWIKVHENGEPLEAPVRRYRWEAAASGLTAVEDDTYRENIATLTAGTAQNGVQSSAVYSLNETVKLLHDRNWGITWRAKGVWDGMLLSCENISAAYYAPYLLANANGSYSLGWNDPEQPIYLNYGADTTPLNLTDDYHVYSLQNEVTVKSDGSYGDNMVYLYVDGTRVAPLTTCYPNGTADGKTSTAVAGKDFSFNGFGRVNFGLSNVTLDYIEINTGCTHSYKAETVDATCVSFGYTTYTCSRCGDSYREYDGVQYSDWQTAKPDVAEELIQSKEQYRASVYETTTSFESDVQGYEYLSKDWVVSGNGTVSYVNSWPSGFDTTNELYSKYNKKDYKISAAETVNSKTVIDSDAVAGYLYYHWCYPSSYYSLSYKSGSYTTFHAYYSTVSPSNYVCDYSDMSYQTSNTACCANSEWFFVAEVYDQNYTNYRMQYRFGRWGSVSDWSDTPIEASETCKVETRTLYRYINGGYGDHDYTSEITEADCTNPGSVTYTCSLCDHSYTEAVPALGHTFKSGKCTTCGAAQQDVYLIGYINGADYGCESDWENLGEYKFVDGKLVATFKQDSYVFLKTGDNAGWYMSDGYAHDNVADLYNTNTGVSEKVFVPGGCEVSFTLTYGPGDVYHLSYTSEVCVHKYVATVITAASCEEEGLTRYICSKCDDSYDVVTAPTGHNYVRGTCTGCGDVDESYVAPTYVLFGYINGQDYGSMDDYENRGEFRFEDGKLVATFSQDSYVAVKVEGNTAWYMTQEYVESTSAVLYNTNTGASEKMFIPAYMEITFTLTELDNDTLNLSYTAIPCKHGYDDTVITAAGCETAGLVKRVCRICTYTVEEEIPATGHKYETVVTEPGCLTKGYTTYTCACGHSYVDDEVAATGHDYKSEVTVEPGCETDGVMTYTCAKCGNSYTGSIGATGHKYTSEVIAPTCLEKGYTLYTCTGCGDSYTSDETPAVGHDYHEKTTTVPGCETEGVKTFTCSRCGDAYEDILEPVGHNYISEATKPTCDEDGFTTHTCTICGNSYADNIVPATGHTYKDGLCTVCGKMDPALEPPSYFLFGWINGADYACEGDYENNGIYEFRDGKLVATFKQDSYIGIKLEDNAAWYMTNAYVEDTTATFRNTETGAGEKMFVPGGKQITFTLVVNEDDTLTLSYTAIDCPHDYEEEITDAPGCVAPGLKTCTCKLCGNSYTEVVDPTGHSYESVVTKPTCTEKGYTTHTCPDCLHSYVDSEVAALGHKTEAETTLEPGCETPGIITYTCTVCGYSYTGSIAATGHSYSSVVTKPTCTEPGYTTYTCTGCDDSYIGDHTPAAGHDYEDTTTKVPNCENDGEVVHTCKVCGDTYIDILEAIGHNYISEKIENTCTDNGYTIHTCTLCGHSHTDSVVPAPGHKNETVTVEPTCDKAGSVTATCSVCGNVDVQELPAKGHTYQDTVITEATCETDGQLRRVCGVCGYSTTETVPATGHQYISGVCVHCGTEDPDYVPVTYYLFGYINGANYACEEDYENMGEFKFENGTLTATFTEDSYVAVKTEGNAKWYMTEGWQEGVTSVTLYDTTTLTDSNKLFVPGGVEVTFTLTENQDDTLTLSYTVPPCEHSYTEEVTTEPTCEFEGVKTFTCSKCGDTYTDTVPATGHSYEKGTCTVCGAADPDYVAPESGYVLVTDLAQITAGGKFVIVANNEGSYQAMSTGIASGKFAGTEVTVNGDCVEGTDLPVWTVEAVEGGITLSTDGSYLAYNSSTNFKMAEEAYIWTVANGDSGYVITGTTAERCIFFQISTAKFGAYAASNLNNSGYVSNLQLYKYQEEICRHEFAMGVCTLCGAVDQTYVSPDYYLFGYINGANYACEEDAENMGEYKFENGTLTATFTEDSYVAVKSEGNAKWYMTEGWQEGVTMVTLYDTATGLTDANKLFVPGGKEVTFTLTENAGTLTLSYTVNEVEPSTAPTVGLKYPSLSFEDVIIMNVYYTATDLEDVVEMGLITYTEKPEAGSVETADKVIPGYTWSESDGFYFSSTAGIAPKDLGDTIYFAVYWKLADGTYGYTRVIGYSPKTYALNQLSTGKVEMRPLVAAMLNYGAAAQNYFNYKTDALVNATMTDEQKALVADYSADMIATVTQASGDKLGEFINDKTYLGRYPTISFEGAFCINYYFQPTLAVEGDVTMYIWSLEDYEAAEVLTKENATKAVKMELTESGEYLGVVDGIAAKDLDKAAYVTFCYNDGTADHCGGVLAYTIGMYCKSQASKTGTLAELAKACAVYGYYAKQLFNK